MRTFPACVKFSLTAALGALAAGCGGGSAGGSCPAETNQLEAQMGTVLSQAVSAVDFSFAVERQDGRRYTFNRGGSTLQTSYESKSASKLVSAVVILRLVQQGALSLSDHPQDHINSWPIDNNDPLFGMTLAQLLSFTSGLTQDPPCLNDAGANFESCVISVAEDNANDGNVPGQEFFYASSHLQVAGLMAVEVRGVSWQAIFSEFKSQTGLFAASSYDAPSSTNPNLAGGMHFTGQDYMDFLKALKGGSLLNASSMGQLLADHTVSIPMNLPDSPIFSGIEGPGLGEDWHYGFGLWHECRSATFNCVAGTRVSSPGARGTYPFWDRSRGYTGIVVLNGVFGTDLITGINIERSVRSTMEMWAAC
jgi:hypothetical protein